jgi:hypothetical protein
MAAIVTGLAAAGNAAGAYTGNTLIDCTSGAISIGSSFLVLLSLGVAFMADLEGLGGTGFLLACASAGGNIVGALFAFVGTVQEIHHISKLAKSMHLGAYKDAVPEAARATKAAKIREGEEKDAREIAENVKKRKQKAEQDALRSGEEGEEEKEDDKKKKVPVMLQRVLFRKPVDGDDDEIPTRMLEDAFAEIDGDGSGSIELEELVDSLKLCGLAVSKAATDVVMKEIDKNASGDVDLREFIEFFRHIEDLNRFQKKTAARQQFVSFLLNFCFLVDIIVVGLMLMLFIKMDETENPDNYIIMKNVLMACSAGLGALFLVVILLPILRLALGPTANKMQKQYELAQEIKSQQRKKAMDEELFSGDVGGPRQAGYTAEDAPPPVNAAMFGRSYRPGKVDSAAWSPAIEDVQPRPGAVVVQAGGRPSTESGSGHGSHDQHGGHVQHQPSHQPQVMAQAHHGGGHGHGKQWAYNPDNYRAAAEYAVMQEAADRAPKSWTPMQIRDVNIPKQTAPAILPGATLALTDTAFMPPQGGAQPHRTY